VKNWCQTFAFDWVNLYRYGEELSEAKAALEADAVDAALLAFAAAKVGGCTSSIQFDP
jgi:hypothetical protein